MKKSPRFSVLVNGRPVFTGIYRDAVAQFRVLQQQGDRVVFKAAS